eukprot:Colp12_sorted_trinity150504_noHs@25690
MVFPLQSHLRRLVTAPRAFVKRASICSFRSLFEGFTAHSSLINKSPQEFDSTTCIIDQVKALNLPVVGYNPHELAEEAIRLSEKPPGPRKPLAAIIRGTGGGKTRCLEEIRRCLLLHQTQEVLPLLVSFNSESKLEGHEVSSLATKFVDPQRCYALSVGARLASTFFGVPFATVLDIVQDNPTSFLTLKPVDIIRGFIEICVQKLESESKRKISHVVVMCDETLRAEEIFGNVFPSPVKEEYNRIFREAVLAKPLLVDSLHATLIVSALDPSPFGKTASDRPIYPFALPESLPPEEVVDKWWELGKVPIVRNTALLI